MGIGKRIASLAEQRGLNLRQLAIKSSVPYNTVYAIVKRDSNRVNWEIIEKLAKAFDIPAASLNGNNTWDVVVTYKDGTVEEIFDSDGIGRVVQEINNPESVVSIIVQEEDPSKQSVQWYLEELPDGRRRLVTDKELETNSLQEFQKELERELCVDKPKILQESEVYTQKSIDELVITVRSICKDDRAVSETQQLHEAELMPARIGLVTDFIKRNADFLKGNMPGMVPESADKK